MPSLRRSPRARASWRAWVAARLRSAAVAASRAAVSAASASASARLAASCRSAELGVARVEAVDLGLQLLVLLLGRDRPLLGLVAGGGEPVDLGLGGGGPRTGGVDLPVQPGQALAAVGDGAGDVLQPALLDGELALQLGPVGDGVLQGALGRFQGGFELGLLLADPGGLALHVLGVAPAPLLRRVPTSRS